MTIEISVIVPVLNERAHIGVCLEALERQSMARDRFEIIVVDNGSTDGSREYIAQLSGITLLDEPRPDPYHARNLGAKEAQGAILAFTDAHCVVETNWLQAIADVMSQSQAYVGPLLHSVDSSWPLMLYSLHHRSKMAYIYEHKLDANLFCHGGNLALSKSLFVELGGFEPLPVAGDTALVQKIARRVPAVAIGYSDKATVRRQASKHLVAMWRKTAEHAGLNSHVGSEGENSSGFETLSMAQRWKVFSKCRREQRLTMAGTVLLGCVLLLTSTIYEAATWRARRASV